MRDKTAAEWTLDPEALGRFLLLLDHDLSEAAAKYERLRRKLIHLFEWRSCIYAEDLADETMNRVIRKIEEGLALPGSAVHGYSAGVAHKVFLEHLREVKRRQPKPGDADLPPFVRGNHETTDLRLDILEQGLSQLSSEDRELIVEYYGSDPKVRIKARQRLARELGINANNLRVKAYRIRARLESWIGEQQAEGVA